MTDNQGEIMKKKGFDRVIRPSSFLHYRPPSLPRRRIFIRIADHSPGPVSLVVESEGSLVSPITPRRMRTRTRDGRERIHDDRNAGDGMMPPHCPDTNSSRTMPPLPVKSTLLLDRRNRPASQMMPHRGEANRSATALANEVPAPRNPFRFTWNHRCYVERAGLLRLEGPRWP